MPRIHLTAPRFLFLPLLAFYALLWAGGVISHLWLGGPPANAGWTAPAFLAVAALLPLAAGASAGGWLIRAGLAGLAFEILGVRTGFPFGHYHYTAVLQPQILGVPLVLACAWMILLGYVRSLLSGLRLSRAAAVLAGSAWMVALDLVIDPVATLALDYWRWPGSGPYFGVPLLNFAGWFLVSALAFLAAPDFRTADPAQRRVGLSVLVFFALIAVAHGLYGPAAVAGLLVSLHAVAAGRLPHGQFRRQPPPVREANLRG